MKANIEVVIQETFKMLRESNQMIDQEKQATLKRELAMIFQVVFSYWCSHASKHEIKKQANHNKKVHLIIGGSHFVLWRMDFILMIGLHQAIKLDFTLLLEKWIEIYVTILFSNIAKVSL